MLKAIANAEKKIVEIRQQRKKFENETEFYKKTLPHEVQKGLADADSDINSQEVFIAEKKKELEVIRAKYDEDKRRFVELISPAPPQALNTIHRTQRGASAPLLPACALSCKCNRAPR